MKGLFKPSSLSVILLPDGDEDLWKDEYFDLVSID